MTKLYNDSDFWEARRQQNRILGWFLGVSGVYLALLVAAFVWYASLPFKDLSGNRPAVGIWIIVVTSVVTALYLFFAFPYMGICFKRSHAYFKMLRFISVGLKEHSVAQYAGVEDWMTRDGVDVNVATFAIRNIKREEEMIRQIYVDGEKDYPPFEERDIVSFVTQGNLLIEYEIVGRAEEPRPVS